jgi:predicted CxxxxCH...CXXCH cytochrome family protein
MRRAAVVLAAVALSACGEERRVETGTPFCPTWKSDMEVRFSTSCASCHSGDEAAAGYDVTSYAGAISPPGRAALATVLDPRSVAAVHSPFIALHPQVQKWATECGFAYLRSSIHPGGILDPMSEDFHGKEVSRQGNRLELCASCHGGDFKGGLAGSDCTTCHTASGGPTACTTCHGTPPASGAHLAHATSPRLGRAVDCAQCHTVPDVYTAAGHVTTAAGTPDPPPAELVFGPLARTGGSPSYDAPSGACSSVYCHGGARPTWTGGPDQAACGTCHGAPPASHPPDTDCARCHVAPLASTHVNGVVDLGDPGGGCTSCHGGPTRPLGGAHRAHLEGPRALAAPLACTDCHVVPATVDAPGHVDSVAPAEVTFGALATSDQASPSFAAGDRSCSGVYCHGGGARLADDAAPTRLAAVQWTSTGGQAACGTCHGVPPVDATHARTLVLRDCVTCHPGTVDGTGAIRFEGGTTLHMNGRPDVVAP